jgi:phosphoglycerol transferase MdoB-like AlkP superfamily enzyme
MKQQVFDNGPPRTQAMDSATQPPWLPRTSLFFLGLLILLMAYFALARTGLLLRNRAAAAGTTQHDLTHAFITGIRFDLAVTCYLLLPFVIIGHLPKVGLAASPKQRKRFFWIFTILLAPLTVLLAAEFEFFHEFQTRFNQLALDYLDHGGTVAGMLWYNYPVARYVLACLAAVVVFALVFRLMLRRGFRAAPQLAARDGWKDPAMLAVLIPLMVFGMRGGFQSEPLRWGDAYRSDNELANQLGLNGLFTLGVSARDRIVGSDISKAWTRKMSLPEARAEARKLVLGPADTLIDPENRTMLRKSGPAPASVSLRPPIAGKPPNVVLVIMESFSARYSGSVGAPRDFTPHFTQLASEGVLFDRAFSSGTHTHQGVFSSVMGFPNLPGHETLMQNMDANQPFATLPAIFEKRGYQTLFIYNGDFSWDNMRGFFQKNGINTFIGKDDYIRPKYHDKVWGVADGDVFERAVEEFGKAQKTGPFFAIVLTLSNHAPFDLPKPLPFEPTTDMGELNGRINGVRYADWAVGKFIDDAKKQPWFDNTLFVFVGDHGFHVAPVMTEVHLQYHHVPLLFYAPKMLTPSATVVHNVACQTNITPTILGLVGGSAEHASWARDLFRTDYTNENAVVFKNSGGGREVALARGDLLLVVGPDGKRSLNRYSLAFPPSLSPVTDPPTADEMERQLRGYVQSALDDLKNHRAGPAHR